MKKYVCALVLSFSQPVFATIPAGHLIAQASFGSSSICGVALAGASVYFNDQAMRSNEELTKAIQSIKCYSANCTNLVEKDLKALSAMTQPQSARLASGVQTVATPFLLFMLLEPRFAKLFLGAPKFFTSLPTGIWTLGVVTSATTLSYSSQAVAGITRYCHNDCEEYRPYLDPTEFAALQAKAERGNSDTLNAWTWSAAFMAIHIGSLFLVAPVVAVAHQRCISSGIEEELLISG